MQPMPLPMNLIILKDSGEKICGEYISLMKQKARRIGKMQDQQGRILRKRKKE